MTAKPQPMAGQPDAADDLIAELAKLMAQDAQGDAPAKPAAAAPFTVRIPGESNSAASAASSVNLKPPAPASAVPPAAAPSPGTPEPFSFDFGLGAPKREAPQPAPTTVSTPQIAPRAPVISEPPAVFDHDSIADLIAAELSNEPVTVPTPAPIVAQSPAPAPVSGWAASAPNLDGQPRQEPSVSPVPAQRSEPDRFKVAPVFGLGTSPVPTAQAPVEARPVPAQKFEPTPRPIEPLMAFKPQAPVTAAPTPPPSDTIGLDPIDEIENLIGRAVHVETKPTQEPPAPVAPIRSLATSTRPAPAAWSGADEAIFAAAQATGAQVGWVEAPEVSEPEPGKRKRAPRDRAPRSFGFSRALAGPLVAVTLLLAAGFGLYWVLGLGRESGPAPLLTADATPVKETPAAEPDAAAVQQSVVFNEMDGVVPGAEEQLLSRDQSDVNEVTQVATPDLSEEGLANRKVRTVTVRPDGSIVSGDDSVAGSAILPVDRPNVPEVPGAETASPELLASVERQPIITSAAAATAVPAPPAATPVTPGSTVPAFDLTGNPIAGKTAVVPLLRPSNLASAASVASQTDTPALPSSAINALIDPTTTAPASATPLAAEPAQPAAAALPTATTPAALPTGATEVAALPNDAPAYVQLASQRSEQEARSTANAMVSRFGPLFGGANMEVQRVDLGAKGIYYRVRVPAASLQEANSMCTNVKAAGGDCFTM